MNQVFCDEYKSFPRFFAEKRYKLCNFAPKIEMVDNCVFCLIIKKKEFTPIVENLLLDRDKRMSKKKPDKFCTYKRPIIYIFSILSLKEKKNKKIM